MERWRVGILILVIHLISGSCGIQGSPPPEYRLFDYIFTNYNSHVRPKVDPSEPVAVTVSYYLTSINSVSEKEQTITIVGWIQLVWIDELLGWNETDFDNITETVVPSDRIWLPDTSFYQGVDKLFFDSKNFPPLIQSSGSVLYTPGGPITLSCTFVLTSYPFDVQNCNIEVSSWSNPAGRLTLVAAEFNVDNLKINGEWSVVSTGALNHTYQDSDGDYSEVIFTIKLRRKALYHILNILLPIILLSLLNLLVFRLPPESGEKVSLSITVLLAFSVWLLMLNGIMPSTSDHVPIMGVYITTFMVISTVSVFITVYVIRMHSMHESYKIPNWLQKIYELRLKLRTNRVTKISKGGDDIDDLLTWKKLASIIDDVALYSLTLFLVVLLTAVMGNLLAQ